MQFEELTSKIQKLVNEKYYNYTFPEDKSYQMYDFYVIDYLDFLINNMPSKNFRDLPDDLVDSVQDAKKKLFPKLREELLDAVFYAVCAELRHADVYKDNRKLFKDNERFKKIYNLYLRYFLFHRTSQDQTTDLQDIYGVTKPSSDIRPPESEKNNNLDRNLSFKAANYAIKESGMSKRDFMEMCFELYRNGQWSPSYGGKAWARICNGWIMLNDADKIEVPASKKPGEGAKPMGVAIDHVYDLQHNTDTVFNKLKSYYKEGYYWIKRALDHKANVKTYWDLLKHTSGQVKSMAGPVLYNRLGQSWEKETQYQRPVKKEEKVEKQPEEKVEKQSDNSNQDYELDDQGNFASPKGLNVGDMVEWNDNHGDMIKGKKYTINQITTRSRRTNNSILYVKTESGDEFGFYVKRFKPATETTAETKAEPAPNNASTDYDLDEQGNFASPKGLKVGDMIEWNNNSAYNMTKGKAYKIDHIESNDNSNYCLIDIKNDKGEQQSYYVKRFKPVSKPKAEPTNASTEYELGILGNFASPKGLKVGDMIEMVEDDYPNMTKGKAYEIRRIESNDFTPACYIFVIDDSDNISEYYVSEFKPVSKAVARKQRTPNAKSSQYDLNQNGTFNSAQGLKVGDDIVCSETVKVWLVANDMTRGKVYKITSIANSTTVYVINDIGQRCKCYLERFKPVTESKPEPTKRSRYELKENGTFKTTKGLKKGDVIVCVNNKPAEITKLTLNKQYLVGYIANSVYFLVKNDDGEEKFYNISKFKPVTEAKAEPTTQPEPTKRSRYELNENGTFKTTKGLKKGDVIVCVDTRKTDFFIPNLTLNKQYLIQDINSSNTLQLKDDNGNSKGYYVTRFKPSNKGPQI